MANEIFRPKKPESGQEKLKKIEDVRQQVEKELSNPDAAFKMDGNIPKAMLDAIAAQKEQKEIDPIRRTEQPNMRMTGSSKLEELLAAIKENTAVYEEITLPSLGKFYNGEDGPADGRLHIRPMTGEEEQILATPRHVKRGQAINMIFQRCIKEKFNPINFVTQDRTFLLIYLRGISYTPIYEVEIKCPNCDRRFGHSIDLNSLVIDTCPESYSQNSLEGVLPTTGLHFTYRLAVGADEQKVQEYRDRRIKEFDSSGALDDTLLYRVAMLVNDVEGLTDKGELQQLLKKLPISDVSYLRNSVNEPPFGIDTKLEIACASCMNDFEMELPLEANFFFPKHKRKVEQV
jgi:hypothetical protein